MLGRSFTRPGLIQANEVEKIVLSYRELGILIVILKEIRWRVQNDFRKELKLSRQTWKYRGDNWTRYQLIRIALHVKFQCQCSLKRYLEQETFSATQPI